MKCIERVYSRDSMLLPGQGGYVTTPDGRWWWIGQFTRDEPEGRVPYLCPVTWEEGWPSPHLTSPEGGERVAPMNMPKPIQGFVPCLPQGSDDFNRPALGEGMGVGSIWRWNHTPRNDYWSLTERPGWLRLKAFRPAKGGGFFQAGNTLMQHTMPSDSTVIETRLDVSRMDRGQRAGLAVFNGGKSYALIGVKDGHIYFDVNDTITEGPALKKGQKPIRLRVYINKEGQARFAYCLKSPASRSKGDRWIILPPSGGQRGDASYQLEAGNFRGARVGLFSYNTEADSGIADFDYFDYQVKNK